VSTDDEQLDYDLSAFEAPEPPEGIADAVLARMEGTGVTPAVPAEPVQGKRRGLLIAGIAAACLAASAGTYVLIQGSRRAGPASGDVVAVRARTLSLDGVNAELDPGAQVKWQRRGTLLDVEQRAGAAAWRVDGDTTIRIDAGAMVASVEATGASLRVEVSMNATDAKVIGASALTAAAVSMVTVTVYTGHVKVSERGQTVIIQPGETHKVVPPQPAPLEPVVAGMPATDDEDMTAPTMCDEVSCVLDDYAGPCCEAFKAGTAPKLPKAPKVADTLDRDSIANTIGTLMPRIRACRDPFDAIADGTIVMNVAVNPDGTVRNASATKTFSQSVSDCVAGIIGRTQFRTPTKSPAFRYPFLFVADGAAVTTTGSSGTILTRQGISKVIALAKPAIKACGAKATQSGTVKVIVKVKPDGNVASYSTSATFDSKVSSCVLDIVKKLTFPATDQGGTFSYPFVFDVADAPPAPPTNCDADELRDKGLENINIGQLAAALSQFEASLRCKKDSHTVQLAYMAACGSRNEAKSRLYFAQLAPAQQSKFRQICLRNMIDPETPGATAGMGYLEVRSTPSAKILIDGVDTGMTTPISGTSLPLKPGKHKVTFVIGADRFTWPATITAGSVFVLDKNLE